MAKWALSLDRMDRLRASLLQRVADAAGPRSVADLRAEGVQASEPAIRTALEQLAREGRLMRSSEQRLRQPCADTVCRKWPLKYRTMVYGLASKGADGE